MTQPDSATHMDQSKHGASVCPSCEKQSGRLFSVTLKGPVKTLTYQCGDCKQQWPMIDYCPDPSDLSCRAQSSNSEDDKAVEAVS